MQNFAVLGTSDFKLFTWISRMYHVTKKIHEGFKGELPQIRNIFGLPCI